MLELVPFANTWNDLFTGEEEWKYDDDISTIVKTCMDVSENKRPETDSW